MRTEPRLIGVNVVRRVARDGVLALFAKICATDEGRSILTATLKDMLSWRPLLDEQLDNVRPPYRDLGAWTGAAHHRDPIFITGRFRSGSTLLWQIFRRLDGCTAYYEPFNERRWFDQASRGAWVDATHHGVSDYWAEYDGLDVLAQYYREHWIDRHLYMDAGFWDPDMKAYISALIERAPGRAVLQFNRVDFRLAWLRHNFPSATIVHLYRHPRDQWCSSLVDADSVPRDIDVKSFAPHDHYYLRMWAGDLKYRFPFLDEAVTPHPYRLFYFLWKLSYLFGVRYADHSLAFESLVRNPKPQIAALFEAAGVDERRVNTVAVDMKPMPAAKWRSYADDEWFRTHEEACEHVLAEFLAPVSRRRPTLAVRPWPAANTAGDHQR